MKYTPEFSLSDKDIKLLEEHYEKRIDDITDREVSEFEDYTKDKEDENRILAIREGE